MAEETDYVRRKQSDYSLTFKIQLVRQIEQGELSITAARKSHGIFVGNKGLNR